MNAPFDTGDLHAVLDRATDALDPPALASGALTEARHRRTRRRGATVAVGTAVAVIAIVIAVRLLGPGETVGPAPAPAPTTPSGGVVATEMVRPALDSTVDLPQDDSLNLPADLSHGTEPLDGRGGSVIAAVQSAGGVVHLVQAGGTWQSVTKATGTLFRHSLTADGGAIALREESQFAIYSMYADRAFSYPVEAPSISGLWANDGVGFFYDLPGPGGESREHEGRRRFSTDSVAFPAGDDLDAIDIAGDGRLHEFVDGDYVTWTNFQVQGTRLDMRHLGDLHGPAAGYDDADVIAVVRSGLGSGEAVDADGVLVLNTAGQPTALLPVEGVSIDEVHLHLWVDETRLLIEIADDLVLWDTSTDERTHVSTIPAGAEVAISDGDGSLVRR